MEVPHFLASWGSDVALCLFSGTLICSYVYPDIYKFDAMQLWTGAPSDDYFWNMKLWKRKSDWFLRSKLQHVRTTASSFLLINLLDCPLYMYICTQWLKRKNGKEFCIIEETLYDDMPSFPNKNIITKKKKESDTSVNLNCGFQWGLSVRIHCSHYSSPFL